MLRVAIVCDVLLYCVYELNGGGFGDVAVAFPAGYLEARQAVAAAALVV